MVTVPLLASNKDNVIPENLVMQEKDSSPQRPANVPLQNTTWKPEAFISLPPRGRSKVLDAIAATFCINPNRMSEVTILKEREWNSGK
ncbi:hypothetical protein CORC01_14109 [Colletotrichum orchidophilum]|uniref:Uncharacterized protein n=1 Tax=Colletotrichum orchidophilum TaxID=1209926 RepID=A0A1G4ANI1_9PEZI|nr:uncharacterized protein CORC01_14109 [Colletotrichum orchidophilum]OHE90603.1 hypothetical protein CORC01_14109 [Colletotrichum orchidophilum]